MDRRQDTNCPVDEFRFHTTSTEEYCASWKQKVTLEVVHKSLCTCDSTLRLSVQKH